MIPPPRRERERRGALDVTPNGPDAAQNGPFPTWVRPELGFFGPKIVEMVPAEPYEVPAELETVLFPVGMVQFWL